MDTAEIPGIQVIADMIRFWVNFSTSPTKTLAPFEGLGDVSEQLLLVLGASLAVSMFIVYIHGRMGLVEIPEVTKSVFGPIVFRITRMDLPAPALLPAVALMFFVATIMLHLFAVTWVWLDQRIHLLNSNLGGSIFDSFNATVAFLAFFIPLATVGSIAAGSVTRAAPQFAERAANIAGIGHGIVILIYYPWALSAVHPDTTYMQAASALGGWPVGLILLAIVWRLLRQFAW